MTDSSTKEGRRNQALDKQRLDFLLEHAQQLSDPNSEASKLLAEGVELIKDSVPPRDLSKMDSSEILFEALSLYKATKGIKESDPWEEIYNRIKDHVEPYQTSGEPIEGEALEYLREEIQRLGRPVLIVSGGL